MEHQSQNGDIAQASCSEQMSAESCSERPRSTWSETSTLNPECPEFKWPYDIKSSKIPRTSITNEVNSEGSQLVADGHRSPNSSHSSLMDHTSEQSSLGTNTTFPSNFRRYTNFYSENGPSNLSAFHRKFSTDSFGGRTNDENRLTLTERNGSRVQPNETHPYRFKPQQQTLESSLSYHAGFGGGYEDMDVDYTPGGFCSASRPTGLLATVPELYPDTPSTSSAHQTNTSKFYARAPHQQPTRFTNTFHRSAFSQPSFSKGEPRRDNFSQFGGTSTNELANSFGGPWSRQDNFPQRYLTFLPDSNKQHMTPLNQQHQRSSEPFTERCTDLVPFHRIPSSWQFSRPARPGVIAHPLQQRVSFEPLMDLLESQARRRRSSTSASSAASYRSEPCLITWKGLFPGRSEPISSKSIFSRKLFVGGQNCKGLDAMSIQKAFEGFALERVDWCQRGPNKAFAYAILENESSVHEVLQKCSVDQSGRFYYKIRTSPTDRGRFAQVIPWSVKDSELNLCVNLCEKDSHNGATTKDDHAIFVGGLHGEMTALDLATIMQTTFGPVVSVGLDTDKYRYPCGTAVVKFVHPGSRALALAAGHLCVEGNKFTKVLQLDPYLLDVLCTNCFEKGGSVFCRHPDCFTYFCPECFFSCHGGVDVDDEGYPVLPDGHEPLARNRVIHADNYGKNS